LSQQISSEPFQEQFAVFFYKLVFPNSQNPPSQLSQIPRNKPVTIFVALNLGIPIRLVRGWTPVALRTPMPEAAINKDAHALLAKNKIGIA
jgi:hypothetical protein